MQSHLLDIIFENRNKEYGAYPLRMNYSRRLFQSISIMLAIVTIFCLLLNLAIKQHKIVEQAWVSPPIILTNPPEVEVVKPAVKQVKPVQQVADKQTNVKQMMDVVPVIVDKQVITNPVPDVADLKDAKISTTTIKGIADAGNISSGNIGNGNTGKTVSDNNIPREEEIMNEELVEKMPEFPGGAEAMKKYLLRNITQPGDLEASEKIQIIASFVVNRMGKIESVKITKNGRKDLDEDIVKAIERMPLWKPGIQNGKNVAVYYYLPISFVSNETN